MSAPAPAETPPGAEVHPVGSALTAAYARMTEVLPALGVTELAPDEAAPTGGGRIAVAGLAEGGADLDAFLAWDDAQVLRDHGRRARPDVIATFGLHRYAWPACLLITVPWFLLRRVPRFPVEHVTFQRMPGRIAVRVGEFACLPDDPAAALPGARVVRDEEALRAAARSAVAEHLEPLLRAFGPRTRRRGHALWGMATDEVVESLWYVAGLLGEQRRARDELERLFPGTTMPYVGTAAFREVTGPNGECLSTRDRASCCFYYTLDAEDTCANCPRNSEAVRIAKLTAEASAAAEAATG
ncbi:(2Fe-2S)-binding protein [Streptomyces sp. NBC_00878]|uniref:(2Fe-2S)-binding protein n=1 Tax=Streptomyces sp. NBC_00878 TaxID=2975854 RepID=UPI0022581325|nr:(2Fe-2S)-binding protein [Streptomyces sp. NBC_00878]MCX4904420.1 (2Fe-2S)-binding protein [Streptomyces sp. NBC_00878]